MVAVGKCSIRDTVFAIGINVLKKSEMLAHCPDDWATREIRGTVRKKGSGRKWVVSWELDDITLMRAHGSRPLTVVPRSNNGIPNPANPGSFALGNFQASVSDTDSDM